MHAPFSAVICNDMSLEKVYLQFDCTKYTAGLIRWNLVYSLDYNKWWLFPNIVY
jgi:hypothetical protein